MLRLCFVVVLALSCLSCGPPFAPKSALAGLQRLPAFPDPPPRAAASLNLPTGVVVDAGNVDLSEVHENLADALTAAGFDKWSVYAYKDGFAMVARWEHIEEDGRPALNRFPSRQPVRIRHGFAFEEHADLLFNAPTGDYRLFVFTVSGQDGEPSADVPIDGADVGAGELPEEIGDRDGKWIAAAHVYLYRRSDNEKAEPIASTPLGAAGHLRSAGIFSGAQLAVAKP